MRFLMTKEDVLVPFEQNSEIWVYDLYWFLLQKLTNIQVLIIFQLPIVEALADRIELKKPCQSSKL